MNAPWNVVKINSDLHAKFHHLFGNKTPREAIDFIIRVFCNGIIDVPKGLDSES